MIPSRDRRGQIESYARWLGDRLGGRPRGAWIPERVWESGLASDLAPSGVEYTVLDDYHFRCAGLNEAALVGDYVVEDQGCVVRVLPASERLRYTIPFAEPDVTIEYLRGIAERTPGAVAVFADDGEKFGSWPHTKQHVYGDRWLRRFFEALVAHREWLVISRLADVIDNTSPLANIYLPDTSYREMTEWSLPVPRQLELQALAHQLQGEGRWDLVKGWIRGGLWRNYRARYSEASELYARMMYVSNKLHSAAPSSAPPRRGSRAGERWLAARNELYRGQCNCAYWHGAFGGIYLPHLRHAIYGHLIAADNLLDRAAHGEDAWVEAKAADFDFDSRQEIRLANDQLVAWIDPAAGGRLYELDARQWNHNLLATMQRRPEAYHQKILAGDTQHADAAASIHDRVVCKQPGLDQRLQYDVRPPKSLVDHFWPIETALADVRAGRAIELGDFADGIYQAKIRRSARRIQVMLCRTATVHDCQLTVTKGVTLAAGSSALEIAYLIEGLPPDREFLFGAEMNFSGMPGGLDNRFFRQDARALGDLGSQVDLSAATRLALVDQWRELDVELSWDQPGDVWAFPIETVSQSEDGFELVHQSVTMIPHWRIRGGTDGRWAVRMALTLAAPGPASPNPTAALPVHSDSTVSIGNA
jgi:alpha-amylase